jgi:hypothetical protein
MVFDVVTTWPKNCDYPQFRAMLARERHRFNEIIIAFMETNAGFDYSPFVRESLFTTRAHFIESHTPAGDDWRNAAVNQSLLHSYNAPHLWFTEQDFIPKPGFFEFVDSHINADCVAVYQGDRMHPCSIFLSREALNKTHKDFSAKPPEYDHFGRIQIDLQRASIVPVVIPPELYFHYNGLSHNWRLACEGQPITYQPQAFKTWATEALEVGVPLHPMFVNMVQNIRDRV